MWTLLTAVLPIAAASTMAGIGVPAAGGAFAHPSEPGALGLVYNPAAAASERAEILLDAGVLWNRYTYALDGEAPEESAFFTPVPFLAATVPVGPVALGAHVFVPYGRASDDAGRPGPARYHTRSGSIQGIEADLAVAASLPPWGSVDIDVGAGPRVLVFRQASSRSFDTGAVLHGILGEEAEVPLQDPFLEGTQSVSAGRGTGLGWAAGVRASGGGAQGEEPRWVLSADYHSAFSVGSVADIRLAPSNDLNMLIEGRAFTELRLPASANLGARIRLGSGRLLASGGWIGWSSLHTTRTEIEGLEVTSPDPLLTAILDGYGLSEAEFLPALGEVMSVTGMQDTLSASVAYDLDLNSRWGVRAGAAYFGNAIPTEYVHPGNCDFSAYDLSLAGRLLVGERWWFGLGTNVYVAPDRVVEQSLYNLLNPSSTGLTYPSGNGTYTLGASRVGLSVRVRL